MASSFPLSSLSSSTVYDSPPARTRKIGTPSIGAATSIRCLNFDSLGVASLTPNSSHSSHYSSPMLSANHSLTDLIKDLSGGDSDDSSFLSDSSPISSRKSSTSSSSSTSSFNHPISSLSSSSSVTNTATIGTSLLSPRKRNIPTFHLPLTASSKKGKIEEEGKEESLDIESDAERNCFSNEIENIKEDPIEYETQGNESQITPVIKIENISYPIRIFSDAGDMNQVWEFTTEVGIVIKGKLLNTAGLIIKVPRQVKKGDQNKVTKQQTNNFKTELTGTIKTFKYFNAPSTREKFKKLGLRISNYYLTPLDGDPITHEQRAFWIVNKMAENIQLDWAHDPKATFKPIVRFEELSSKSKKLLEVIRNVLSYLLENAHNLATDIICRLDFHKKNFMFDLDGEICYVDGNLRWDIDDEFDLLAEIATWFKGWCANNSNISRYLLADMMTKTWFKEWIANHPDNSTALLENVIATPWFQEWIANNPEISNYFKTPVRA